MLIITILPRTGDALLVLQDDDQPLDFRVSASLPGDAAHIATEALTGDGVPLNASASAEPPVGGVSNTGESLLGDGVPLSTDAQPGLVPTGGNPPFAVDVMPSLMGSESPLGMLGLLLGEFDPPMANDAPP